MIKRTMSVKQGCALCSFTITDFVELQSVSWCSQSIMHSSMQLKAVFQLKIKFTRLQNALILVMFSVQSLLL